MKPAECPRELEILEAVSSERWPPENGSDLRDHACTCPVCRDTVEVALAFREDRAAAILAARVPSAGLVWWRAEMRSRRDAVSKATRPIRIVESVAAGCAAAGALGLLVWFGLPALEALLWQPSIALFVVLGALILLVPIALYFVFSGD
jgi:hypothetical protein